jgi:hypothetical protein
MREVVLAHHGEEEDTYAAFQNFKQLRQDSVIEFLKSLRIVPEKRQNGASEP